MYNTKIIIYLKMKKSKRDKETNFKHHITYMFSAHSVKIQSSVATLELVYLFFNNVMECLIVKTQAMNLIVN